MTSEKSKPVKENENFNLSSYLVAENLRVEKNKTFYFDEEVIKKIHEQAVTLKTTDSKLCNDILRSVLGI